MEKVEMMVAGKKRIIVFGAEPKKTITREQVEKMINLYAQRGIKITVKKAIKLLEAMAGE